MKHLVASSIAAPSVPCFSPQPLLSLLYLSGTQHSKTWSTERPVMTNIFLHFFNHCWTSQMWFLYALSNRNACNTREAEFSRKSVKDDYLDFPLTCFSPVPKRLCC